VPEARALKKKGDEKSPELETVGAEFCSNGRVAQKTALDKVCVGQRKQNGAQLRNKRPKLRSPSQKETLPSKRLLPHDGADFKEKTGFGSVLERKPRLPGAFIVDVEVSAGA